MVEPELLVWTLGDVPPVPNGPLQLACACCLKSSQHPGFALAAFSSSDGQEASLCADCAQNGCQPLTLATMQQFLNQDRLRTSFASFLSPTQLPLAATKEFDARACCTLCSFSANGTIRPSRSSTPCSVMCHSRRSGALASGRSFAPFASSFTLLLLMLAPHLRSPSLPPLRSQHHMAVR